MRRLQLLVLLACPLTSACSSSYMKPAVPITPEHKDWAGVQDLVAGLECRTVIPERAAEHEERRREKARKLM